MHLALRLSFLAAGLAGTAAAVGGQTAVITLEDAVLGPGGFNNGAGGGALVSGGAAFANTYNAEFASWTGWAFSNQVDTATAGFANQYSAFPGAAGGGSVFAVAYTGFGSNRLTLPAGFAAPQSALIANTTYAALSMRDGDAFAKKFGGAAGTDPDFFRLTIRGFDAGDVALGAVELYLADFRSADPAGDYLLDSWRSVDLTPLGGGVAYLEFVLDSSDNSPFGMMNTPAYFALDNLTVAVPEPGLMGLLAVGLAALARRGGRRPQR